MTSEPQPDPIPIVGESAPRVTLGVAADGGPQRHIPCRRAVTLIGSRSGCKIRLEHKAVAPVHAAIVHTGSHVHAVDLTATGHTLFNGLKLQQERLTGHDIVTVEAWTFHVDVDEPTPPPDDAPVVSLDPAPMAFGLEHIATGRLMQPTRPICVMGRRSGSDITIADAGVSRAHAMLFTYADHPTVVDLLSENGTYVNGDAVAFRRLTDGDTLVIGDSTFRVRLALHSAHRNGQGNGVVAMPSAGHIATPDAGDKVDIKATEGSQRWKIAEHYEKLTKES